ncbi:MAG: hypothetical protein NTW19_10300 [Planctomycetota bacterium]|nr:hypothetical protein [Planctomycetota bacterium]
MASRAQTEPPPTDRPAAEALPYRRVDLAAVEAVSAGTAAKGRAGAWRLRWPVVALAVALSLAQAAATVVAINVHGVWLTASMIPVFAFALIAILVAVVNPAWGLLRGRRAWLPRPFNRVELTHLFAAMLVSSGVSSYGLSQQIVPLIATPWNPSWNTAQRGWKDRLLPTLNQNLYLTDPAASRLFYEGITRKPDGRPLYAPREDAPYLDRLAFHRDIFLQIPWRSWLAPLGAWMVMVLAAYTLFYSLTRLMLDHWIDREKLIFPMSRLAEAMLPNPPNETAEGTPDRAPDETSTGSGKSPPASGLAASLVRRGIAPAFLFSGVFWLGFAVSFGVQSFNALNLPDLHIRLGMPYWTVNNILQGTVLEGLGARQNFNALMFLIIFTAIGLAFLLPTEIAFSIWFYYVAGKLAVLAAVWAGHGRNGDDFPADWFNLSNAFTAQGGGAMLLFAAVVLARALVEHWRQGSLQARGLKPGVIPGAAPRPPWTLAQRLRHAQPVIAVVASILVLVAWLNWNRVPVLWASAYVLVTTLMCLGLMRFVAEAGIYWFQTFVSFFHLHRAFGLGRFMAPSATAPLVPINSVLFMDVKCLLAGYLVTAGWLERHAAEGAPPDEAKQLSRRSRIGVTAALALAVVLSIVLTIHMAYAVGGDRMHAWVFRNGPQTFVDGAARAALPSPRGDSAGAGWFGLGAAWCGLSMFARRTLFGFPHPIGYAMLANPLTAHIWLPCFIGWACKKVVVRYGGKATFDHVRLGFIGLILGEVLAIAFWLLASLLTGKVFPTLDLNRYGV